MSTLKSICESIFSIRHSPVKPFNLLLQCCLAEVKMRLVKDYYKIIADHKDVNKTVMMLSSSIKGFQAAVNLRLQQETTYNFLWEQDREEVVKVTTQAFLL